jgi:hypothetical protein
MGRWSSLCGSTKIAELAVLPQVKEDGEECMQSVKKSGKAGLK